MADSTPTNNVNAPKAVISDASVDTNLIVNSPIQTLPKSKEIFVYIEVCASRDNPKGSITLMKHHKGLLWTVWNCYTPGVCMTRRISNFHMGLDKFNTTVFAGLVRNSIDFLVECPF
jgi:hypothetical protein